MKSFIIVALCFVLSNMAMANSEESFKKAIAKIQKDFRAACAKVEDDLYENCGITFDFDTTPQKVITSYMDDIPSVMLSHERVRLKNELSKKIEKSLYTDLLEEGGAKIISLANKLVKTMLKYTAYEHKAYISVISASSDDAYIYDHFVFCFESKAANCTSIEIGFSN